MLILKVSCDIIDHLTLEADPDQPAEFPEDILSIYLDSFVTTTSTDDNTTDDDTELPAGAIAGIVIAVVVVIISVVVAVIAVSIYCHRRRRSGSL